MLRNLVRKLPLFDLYPDHLAYLLYQSDTLWPQSASVNEASARRTARVSKSSATTSAISTLAIRRAGLVNASFSVQSLFGTQWHRHSSRGRGAYEAHRRPAVRTGSPLVGAGRRSQPLRWPPQAIAAGCDVRVGLKDWLWIGKGQLAKSTAEWVILRLNLRTRPHALGCRDGAQGRCPCEASPECDAFAGPPCASRTAQANVLTCLCARPISAGVPHSQNLPSRANRSASSHRS
ncbi:MAG: hypothetical protein EOR97_27355 [Mesorhizobium sp.]|uniref:3-keto-5-aminohexanoate cleavage protein n=1 Tax=Mesorhizobium sp. TaxID=1871066 RepID=UPI000FE86BEB|nr:MAG: hypothetical protein EOR97_27355 [Mesorhizobium sp.]